MRTYFGIGFFPLAEIRTEWVLTLVTEQRFFFQISKWWAIDWNKSCFQLPWGCLDGCGRGAGPGLRRVCSMVGLEPSLPEEQRLIGRQEGVFTSWGLLWLSTPSNCSVIARSISSGCLLVLDNPCVWSCPFFLQHRYADVYVSLPTLL